jgi:carbamoyltransferase
LRRSKGIDAVMMFAEDGAVFAVWHGQTEDARKSGRFREWQSEWRVGIGAVTVGL